MTELNRLIKFKEFLVEQGIDSKDRNLINNKIVEMVKQNFPEVVDYPNLLLKNELIDTTLPFYTKGNVKINESTTNEYPGIVIKQQLTQGRVLILKAGTGIGKSTQITRIFDEQTRILMTQPRRLITRTLAEKIANQLNQSIGEEVGYVTGGVQIKGSRINIITEGILVQMLMNTKNLQNENIDYIILDEVHERTTNMDLILFFLKEALLLNLYNFKIIIMSATFEPKIFRNYFGESISKIIYISGQTSKIDVNYLENPVNNYLDEAVKIISNLPENELGEKIKDVLVFLPTIKLINDLESKLIQYDRNNQWVVTKLYSGIEKSYESLAMGDLVQLGFDIHKRRIILSTDVSETGFTFVSLKYVIDSGWVNKSYYDPISDCNVLMLDAISKATAHQRWGRVGRVAPGIVYPLYTQGNFNDFNEDILPQIYGENLDKLILDILNYGEKVLNFIPYDISKARLIDVPPLQSINRSFDTLNKLYLIDSDCILTDFGKKLTLFQEDPRYSKCLIASVNFQCVRVVSIVLAMINIGLNNLIDRRLFKRELIDNAYQSDHLALWILYQIYEKHNNDIDWCLNHGLKWKSFEQVEEYITTLESRLIQIGIPLICRQMNIGEISYSIKRSLMAGFGDNIAIQSDYNNKVYISLKNKNINGTIIDSYVFTNKITHLSEFYPKYIIYDKVILKKSPDGIMKYGFSNISCLDENVFFTEKIIK